MRTSLLVQHNVDINGTDVGRGWAHSRGLGARADNVGTDGAPGPPPPRRSCRSKGYRAANFQTNCLQRAEKHARAAARDERMNRSTAPRPVAGPTRQPCRSTYISGARERRRVRRKAAANQRGVVHEILLGALPDRHLAGDFGGCKSGSYLNYHPSGGS